MRLVDDTRAQYLAILERFKRWLHTEYPSFVVDTTIQLPLPSNICQMYLDYASIKRNTRGEALVPKQYNTFSTIGTSKSALKFLYKEANVTMDEDLESRLKDFANGYKRHIAQLKEDGVMPIGEGKLPMSVDVTKKALLCFPSMFTQIPRVRQCAQF
ncbi:hypothetical protein H257_17631 [Aphanomyces astaci]|uniref:Uncharacterized protein n=1 Tax=Aphanomyces astaci TaxID=112090 RepID=W4FE37_APHAT|nr:hypothetical protein H257_17631 [Aphanomyces astaci]ETV65745.1 hypothetical protein H257_17631 [Aphanomyces astaci]|eukprot:XP_009844797.1 hypothetical protein H257_17631 [Aphanomyces astaci]